MLLSSLGVLGLLAVWHWFSRSGIFPALLLPSPLVVYRSLRELLAEYGLWTDVAASLQRVFFGFFLSTATAAPIGLAIGLFPAVRRLFEPVLLLLRPIPPIAWIPLAILWFGIGNGPAYFLTMVASFFPILLNTSAGVEAVHVRHIEVARCFGAGRLRLLRHVILPSALPQIFTGLRVGFGVAWMAVIAAELVASHSGLGYLIHTSQDMLRADRAMAGMLVIGALGLGFDRIFHLLQRQLAPWGKI